MAELANESTERFDIKKPEDQALVREVQAQICASSNPQGELNLNGLTNVRDSHVIKGSDGNVTAIMFGPISKPIAELTLDCGKRV